MFHMTHVMAVMFPLGLPLYFHVKMAVHVYVCIVLAV